MIEMAAKLIRKLMNFKEYNSPRLYTNAFRSLIFVLSISRCPLAYGFLGSPHAMPEKRSTDLIVAYTCIYITIISSSSINNTQNLLARTALIMRTSIDRGHCMAILRVLRPPVSVSRLSLLITVAKCWV